MSLSEQWASRPWNTDTGRLVWWLRQHARTGSYASRRALRAFWLIALQESGEVASRAAVRAAGLELPAWLVGQSTAQPEQATGERLERAA